jgi:hypothetical protein
MRSFKVRRASSPLALLVGFGVLAVALEAANATAAAARHQASRYVRLRTLFRSLHGRPNRGCPFQGHCGRGYYCWRPLRLRRDRVEPQLRLGMSRQSPHSALANLQNPMQGLVTETGSLPRAQIAPVPLPIRNSKKEWFSKKTRRRSRCAESHSLVG